MKRERLLGHQPRILKCRACGDMIADRETIPGPTPLDAIMSDAANRDAVAFLVNAPVGPTRAVRINITLPEEILEQIDRVARNRSRFLAEAARAARPPKPWAGAADRSFRRFRELSVDPRRAGAAFSFARCSRSAPGRYARPWDCPARPAFPS